MRRYTVNDALDDWLAQSLDGMSASTVTLYGSTIAKALREELGTIRLTDLTAKRVQTALRAMAHPVNGARCGSAFVTASTTAAALGRSSRTVSWSMYVAWPGYSASRRVTRILSTGRRMAPIDAQNCACTACVTARCPPDVVARSPWICSSEERRVAAER